jgi:hypothetical protein
MCAACVAQGVGYVGASLAGLRVMAAHARARRLGNDHGTNVLDDAPADEPTPAEPEPVAVSPSAF